MNYRVVSATDYDQINIITKDTNETKNGTRVQTAYSMISPGTELFCIGEAINSGTSVEPGYILTGTDDEGRGYFLFPCLERSSGCHCDIRHVSPDSLLIEVPKNVPLCDACFLRFANIGLYSFNQAQKQTGKVAVIGLGPVGNIACQTGRLLGWDVTGIDLSSERMTIARQCGINTVASWDQINEKAKVFDFIIDTVVADATINTAMRLLVKNGEYSMVGIVKPGEVKASQVLNMMWQKNIVARSGWEMLAPLKGEAVGVTSTESNLKRALRWIENGSYKFEPLLTGIVPAREEPIRQAYQALKTNPNDNMCYVIDWRK